MVITVTLVNPISGADIRTYEFTTIKEMNEFLAYVVEVNIYAYRINTSVKAYRFTRAA